MNIIKEISANETYFLRISILRKGKPIEFSYFTGDNEPTTCHFGYFKNEVLIGIVSLFKNNHRLFNQENQYQIRGMAVAEEHQHSGIGKKLIHHLENFCLENNINFLWFNARVSAQKFYEKLGYVAIGEVFPIEDAGPHIVMYKEKISI